MSHSSNHSGDFFIFMDLFRWENMVWNIAIIFLIFSIFPALCLTGCSRLPRSHLPLYQRSQVVMDSAVEEAILSSARVVESRDDRFNRIKVLHLKGSPYEMGFQHGRLIKEDVRASIFHVLGRAKLLVSMEAMEEVFDLMAPFIPQKEMEEMRGLAHGADLPLKLVHWFHTIPGFSEFGGRKQYFRAFKSTSCSNVAAFGAATMDQSLWQLRVLDWNRQLGVQKWPVILVHQPDQGHASVTFSYAGFIGCVSGMNDQHLAFGEMGYGNPPGESLEGMPFIFLFRKLMRQASDLNSAVNIIRSTPGTCSYAYVIGDSKPSPPQAVLVVRSRQSLNVYRENTAISDPLSYKNFPAVEQVVYAGADEEKLFSGISGQHGSMGLGSLQKLARLVARRGNMQNVIFRPASLEAWVTNASNATRDEEGKACNQPWFYFNLSSALKGFR